MGGKRRRGASLPSDDPGGGAAVAKRKSLGRGERTRSPAASAPDEPTAATPRPRRSTRVASSVTEPNEGGKEERAVLAAKYEGGEESAAATAPSRDASGNRNESSGRVGREATATVRGLNGKPVPMEKREATQPSYREASHPAPTCESLGVGTSTLEASRRSTLHAVRRSNKRTKKVWCRADENEEFEDEAEDKEGGEVEDEDSDEDEDEGEDEVEIFKQCPDCGKMFKSHGGLRYHRTQKVCMKPNNTPPDNEVRCEKKAEEKEAGNGAELTCLKCGKLFTSIGGLQYHRKQMVCVKRVERWREAALRAQKERVNLPDAALVAAARNILETSADGAQNADRLSANAAAAAPCGRAHVERMEDIMARLHEKKRQRRRRPPPDRPSSLISPPNAGTTLKGKPRRNARYDEHGDKPWLTQKKRDLRPSWLEFRPAKSCWYIEVYRTLKFKRGANNTKWIVEQRDRTRFNVAESHNHKRNIKRIRKRVKDKGMYPELMKHLGVLKGTQEMAMYHNVYEFLGYQKRKSVKPSHRRHKRVIGTIPSIPGLTGNEDCNYETHRTFASRLTLGNDVPKKRQHQIKATGAARPDAGDCGNGSYGMDMEADDDDF